MDKEQKREPPRGIEPRSNAYKTLILTIKLWGLVVTYNGSTDIISSLLEIVVRLYVTKKEVTW